MAKLGYIADVLSRLHADIVVINELCEPESFTQLVELLPDLRHKTDCRFITSNEVDSYGNGVECQCLRVTNGMGLQLSWLRSH